MLLMLFMLRVASIPLTEGKMVGFLVGLQGPISIVIALLLLPASAL